MSPEFVFKTSMFSYSATHFYNSQNIKKLWNDKSKEMLLCSLIFNFFLHQKSFGFFFSTLSEGNMHTQVLKRVVVNVSTFIVSNKRKKPLKKDCSILNFLAKKKHCMYSKFMLVTYYKSLIKLNILWICIYISIWRSISI